MSIFKCRSWPLAASAGMLAALTSVAHAKTDSLPLGAGITVNDPSGSGLAKNLQLIGGSVDVTLDSGPYFDRGSADSIGGAAAWLNAGGIQVVSKGGFGLREASIVEGTSKPVRYEVGDNIAATGVTLDSSTAGGVTVSSENGFSLVGTKVLAFMTGGTASVTNMRVDLVNKLLVADLDGVRNAIPVKRLLPEGAPEQVFTQHDVPLWTFDTITGPYALPTPLLLAPDPAAGLAAIGYTVSRQILPHQLVGQTDGSYVPCAVLPGRGDLGNCFDPTPRPIYADVPALVLSGDTLLKGMKLTGAGAQFFTDALGLGADGIAALQAVEDFGQVRVKTTFALTVPEPGNWALMGLGLCLMSVVTRRKNRAST